MSTSHRRLDECQLMVVAGGGGNHEIHFDVVGNLGRYVSPKDLLVMNVSGTIPGSFWVKREKGKPFELRLAAFAGRDSSDLSEWHAVVFGEGDWRRRTEDRGPAPAVSAGEFLMMTSGGQASLAVEVLEVDAAHPRLLKIRFHSDALIRALYEWGRPIQYSYHDEPLSVWDVQTLLAQRPISVEPPSALLPLSWQRLLELRNRVPTAYLLHGAGLSSTGNPDLDAKFPLPEYYEIPNPTVEAVRGVKSRGGRLIAIGTTVARSLESADLKIENSVKGITDLKIGASHAKLINGLLTGYHEPGSSHFELESALLPRDVLLEAFEKAKVRGFLGHEFGDAVLIFDSMAAWTPV